MAFIADSRDDALTAIMLGHGVAAVEAIGGFLVDDAGEKIVS